MKSDTPLEALRADYRMLQSTASKRVSEAVSRSTRIFSDASKPVRLRDSSSDQRTITHAKISSSSSLDRTDKIRVSSKGTGASDTSGLVLNSAVPLMGESGDPESVFLNLVAELMKPRQRPVVIPSRPPSSARASPAPSVASSNSTSMRAKSLALPRGFGSSTARFPYEKPSFADRVREVSRKSVVSIGG